MGVWFVAAVPLLAGLFAVAVWAVRAAGRQGPLRRRHELARPPPVTSASGRTPMSATELTRSDVSDENLDACRVRCHVWGPGVRR